MAARIEAERDELALIETLESGKPISQAKDEVSSSAGIWYYAATLAQHGYGDAHNGLGENYLALTVREPVGVVGIITPWNFPLLIVSQKLPFALAAGCTAVVKPSDLTPGTTTRLVQILHEEGLPAGAVNLVHGGGDVGGWLSGHPGTQMTTFTETRPRPSNTMSQGAPPDNGEGGDVGARVTRQPAADVAAAVHQVDRAGRQALLVQDLDEAGGGSGGQVAGLDHRGTADREGEWKLLRDDQQREIPRCDHPDDADRFFDRDGQIVRPRPLWASP